MSEGTDPTYVCGPAARWLPRVLAATLLVAGLLAAARVGSGSGLPAARPLRGLIALLAGAGALWIVRRGGEVRLAVVVGRDGLSFVHGRRRVELPFDDVESLRYEAPFGSSRSWLPATVLLGRDGREWRLSALLDRGGEAIRALLERSGRSEFAAWAESQQIAERMARSAMRVRIGYAVAAGFLLAALAHGLR